MKIDTRYTSDDRTPIFLGYDEIADRVEEFVDDIRLQSYDAIVVILRGGTFPGMHLSFLTGVPVYFLQYDRESCKTAWYGEKPLAHQKVLLVEDFAGRGTTLTDCIDFLFDYRVDTFVVCKDSLSRLQHPTYCCFDLGDQNARYIVPWERHEYHILKSGVHI